MKKLCFLIFIGFFLKSNAQQVQAPIICTSLAQMEAYPTAGVSTYYQAIVTDSATGGLFTKKLSSHSANNVTTFPSATAGYLWFKLAASPIGNFITRVELLDSLANYVNLYGSQTVLATAPKEWQADQTFDASMIQNFKGNSIDRHQVLDSINNITHLSTNVFVNSFRNINYNYHAGGGLPGAVGVTNSLLLDDIADTLGTLVSSQAAFNAQIAFHSKNGTVASTYSVTNFNKNGSLIAASIGTTLLIDSTDIIAGSKTWNIDVPMVGVLSHFDVPRHGTAYSYTDFDAGLMTLLDSTSNDYTLTTRYGFRVRDLSNPHTTNTYAIKQEGATDSILLNTKNIKTPSLTTGTAAYIIQMDANGNWIKKAYIPTVSATLDFTSTSAQSSSDLTVTVTGAAVGDLVQLGLPASPLTNSNFTAWVSASNTVKVRYNNYSSGAQDPASATYKILVTPQ